MTTSDPIVAANPEEQGWETRPLPDLIHFIVTHFHEPLRLELRSVIDNAKKVERVHVAQPSCPRGLAQHLESFASELKQHMMKEEQMLFPAISSGVHGPGVHMPVRVMMQEHDDHSASLARTRELATSFSPPSDACATWTALYAALEKLEADLVEHIHLEDTVLFPRALAATEPA